MIICVFVACTQQKKAEPLVVSPEPTGAQGMINGKDTILLSAAISDNEMKDDSVFADGSIPTSWENAGITDVKGLKLFLKELQQNIINMDKEKMAAAVKYPLKGIKTEQEMIAAYETIFTKEVKLSFATINFNQIFRNQNGVMLGNGKVWINQFGKDFKIYSIN